MTERIRIVSFRVALILAACGVACAGLLSSPVQAASTPAAQGRPAAETATGAVMASQLLTQRSISSAPKDLAAVGGSRLASSGVVVNYPSAATSRLPSIPCSAYTVADAGTGQVLAAKDAHAQLRPASTLKMLTAVTLLPLLNRNAYVTASSQAAHVTPNIAGLVAGSNYKVASLWNALLLISANDAAIALAQSTGSLSTGISLMNAEAHHLQAYDVAAKDPNGLDAPGQHVSAYDLALIARAALNEPAFLGYDQTRTYNFKVSAHKTETLANQNSLLSTYPGALGGKIGWTSAAGATYIGLAQRNGRTLIVTELHCPALTEINYAKSLLNWGFALDGKVTPVGKLVSPLALAKPQTVPKFTVPKAAGQPVTSGSLTASHVPSGLAAASIALIVFAAGAAIVLILLRRRSPSR
ncbi:MAG TPA: D-alanyl-D-alanine carboxypeptidase [Streptosporangiaceae bacterium]|nr:D-alanyl-D-alanine carboxypeptidase [Streptosporangiaceae bacterium]